MMAELIVGGARPDAAISFFSFERFYQNQPITGQYKQSIVG